MNCPRCERDATAVVVTGPATATAQPCGCRLAADEVRDVLATDADREDGE